MATDEAYTSFLERANQNTGGTKPSSTTKPSSRYTLSSEETPVSLRNISTTFTSETDEPFEPVFLECTQETIDAVTEQEFHTLHGGGGCEELTMKEFDPRGKYKEVISRVEECVRGHKVKIFSVASGTRVEYWILGVRKEAEGSGLIGVMARAVES